MPSFEEIIIIDKSSNIPVYLQITNAIIHNIRRGQLRSGLKLPGSRELASALKIHRKTLQTAYDELMAQGWVEIVPRKGTFIVKDLPEIKPVRLPFSPKLEHYPERTAFSIDEKSLVVFPVSDNQKRGGLYLDDGLPDTRLAPAEILIKEYRRLSKLSAFKKYYNYGGPKGPAYLLEILAVFLSKTRGLSISTDNILITKGAQMGIYLASKLLLKPGDNVVLGEPGYFAAALTFKQAGAIINRVPVDDFGIDIDSVESICKKKNIRMLYVIPHHHFPTTVTLIPERRMKLLELAARYKFAIIEDDYDYDFHYNSSPVLPMASLDHNGNTIYIGTLTKTFVPAIRMGFLIAPENFIDAAANVRRVIDWQGDSMMEVAIAQLYKDGTIERLIKKAVKLYRQRRDYFCEQLKTKLGEHVTFNVPDGGMAVWTKFNNVDLKLVSARAAIKGLSMSNVTIYNTGAKNYNSTRLGFASLNLKEQDKAIEILKNSI